jgi:hypothetical protein
MADSKITALTALTAADPANDMMPIVDVSDTSMAASGTTKRISINNILACSPTATLASATITGDLTVRTTGLILNTSGLGVGITPTSFGAGYGTIQVSGSTGAGIRMGSPTNGSFIYSDASFFNFVTETNVPYRFQVNNQIQHTIAQLGVFTWFDGAGGTRMTLNSTGLGVGGSPAAKIFASVTPPGAGQDGMRVSDGTRLIQMAISGSTYNYQGIGANQNVIYASGNPLSILSDAQNLRLGTGTNGYMLIDTSGNVGVGVTPSVNSLSASGYRGLEVGSVKGFGLYCGNSEAYLWSNLYYDGGLKYANSNTAAASFYQNAGQFIWYNAPSSGVSGAGTAATLTPRMTLDASGRLLVGTTASGTSAGDGIIGFGTRGLTVGNSNASVASGSFIDITISTTANGYQGFLSVANTQNSNANVRTQTTFSVFGRGSSATFTTIATADGPTSGASFTVTVPSNGVIRITNTVATFDTTISAQFFGGTSA